MFNHYVYIADNQINQNLPVLDTNEIPPLPAFQTQSSSDIKQDYFMSANTGIVTIALVVVIILLFILIGLYLKIRKQVFSVMPSNEKETDNDLSDNSNKTIIEQSKNEKENIVTKKEKSNIRKDLNIETSDNMEYSSTIGFPPLRTPSSIEKCIKFFLEITKEK